MKLIAHRGASLICRENTLESLVTAARMGADAVECDVQMTRDGEYVIYHDPTLERIAKDPRAVSESTLEEMSEILEKNAGYRPPTLRTLAEGYREKAPVLLDIAVKADAKFLAALESLPFPFIVGVSRMEDVALYRKLVPPERLLGFLPEPGLAMSFRKDGCGIIRLWENWLGDITPADIKRMAPGTEVWIMSNRNGNMDGSAESIARLKELGADGVLLNDVTLLPFVKG